ncbi:hypothetical protein ACROYT_G040907 [Oculina patagonica]
MICVGKDQGGVGGCHGDSGGPLVCEFSGKWYLEGAASWAGMPCASPSKYTVYAKIRYLKSWIIGKTNGVTSCNFDTGWCSGWQQSDSDVFDWTRQKGPSLSSNTGPSSDHTSGTGYYMYIETSYPRVAGDNAKITFSVSGNGELACLTFYYHMYGESTGTLTVLSGKKVVFSTSGNHGNDWIKAEIKIYLDKTVTFEGKVGSSFTGDIAIDDVSISRGSCFSQTTAPPPSPTPTYAPSLASLHSSSPSIHNPSLNSPQLSLMPSSSSILSTYKTALHSLPSSFMPSISSTSSYRTTALHSLASTLKPSNSRSSSTHQPELTLHSVSSTIYPSKSRSSSSTLKPSLPTSDSQDYSLTTIAFQPSPSISTLAPRTPSNKEKQESVMLEIRDLDTNKWDKNKEDDFKREVAKVATKYCAADEKRCQSTSTSSRRRRSSDNMVFSGDMVHILPGYPKQSPDDPLIALLAFYLQLPQGFSENVVHRDALKAIVNSNMSSIGGSIGSTILRVEPLRSITDSPDDKDEDKQGDGESKPVSAIIGSSVGGVVLFVIIVTLLLCFKRSNRFNSQEGGEESAVKENDGVNEGVDGVATLKRSANNARDNNTVVSMGQSLNVMCDNRTRSSENAPYKKTKVHHLHVIKNTSSANEELQDVEECVRNICKETTTKSKQFERNEAVSNSTDGVVLRFQEISAEKPVAAKSSNDTKYNSPKKRNKRENEADENKDVDESVVNV